MCGELTIKRGLKRRARKRKLVIDREMKRGARAAYARTPTAITCSRARRTGEAAGSLGARRRRWHSVRKKIKTHPDAGLHALRHTFLTEAGEYTDPFTLQYVAGHDNIKTTMRYVHPREEAVEKLFVRLGNLERPETRVECKRSVQNPVQLG